MLYYWNDEFVTELRIRGILVYAINDDDNLSPVNLAEIQHTLAQNNDIYELVADGAEMYQKLLR